MFFLQRGASLKSYQDKQSSSYYDQKAQDFFDSTFDVSMDSLYQPFLARLEPGALIIDAGCGSGRDALAFTRRGYRVLAFDVSVELVTLARQQTGLDIRQCSFLDFQTAPESVQGIWACASLLHLPYQQIPTVFKHLSGFLVSEGIFYCSFKYGIDDVQRDGRYFTNLDEARLQMVVERTDLRIDQLWVSADQRPERKEQRWLNAFLSKI